MQDLLYVSRENTSEKTIESNTIVCYSGDGISTAGSAIAGVSSKTIKPGQFGNVAKIGIFSVRFSSAVKAGDSVTKDALGYAKKATDKDPVLGIAEFDVGAPSGDEMELGKVFLSIKNGVK